MTEEQIEKGALSFYPAPISCENVMDCMGPAMDRGKFKLGAKWALANQWISIDERLPEPHEEVLTYTKYAIHKYALAYCNSVDWHDTLGCRIRPNFWLPIPQLNP